MKDLHEETLWQALTRRDTAYCEVFFYGVRTTGVFCRPGCPSPVPKRENVVFAFSAATLQRAGFRACRRCRPGEPGHPDASVATVVRLCRLIEESSAIPTMMELAECAGMSESAVGRLFGEALGVTAREYADAHRRERFRKALRRGADILDATYDSGYGSSSRVYEGSNNHLGMTPRTYRDGGQRQEIAYTVSETPLGYLLVAATAKGISAVKLGDDADALVTELRHEFNRAELREGGEELSSWTESLVGYLSARLPWPELPYDVAATAFQRRVWEHLHRIPAGETVHYGEVAAQLGQPAAARAVARACATNPVALVVPCHRVVPKGSGLAGYRWGIERKRRLLDLEGATMTRE